MVLTHESHFEIALFHLFGNCSHFSLRFLVRTWAYTQCGRTQCDIALFVEVYDNLRLLEHIAHVLRKPKSSVLRGRRKLPLLHGQSATLRCLTIIVSVRASSGVLSIASTSCIYGVLFFNRALITCNALTLRVRRQPRCSTSRGRRVLPPGAGAEAGDDRTADEAVPRAKARTLKVLFGTV